MRSSSGPPGGALERTPKRLSASTFRQGTVGVRRAGSSTPPTGGAPALPGSPRTAGLTSALDSRATVVEARPLPRPTLCTIGPHEAERRRGPIKAWCTVGVPAAVGPTRNNHLQRAQAEIIVPAPPMVVEPHGKAAVGELPGLHRYEVNLGATYVRRAGCEPLTAADPLCQAVEKPVRSIGLETGDDQLGMVEVFYEADRVGPGTRIGASLD